MLHCLKVIRVLDSYFIVDGSGVLTTLCNNNKLSEKDLQLTNRSECFRNCKAFCR